MLSVGTDTRRMCGVSIIQKEGTCLLQQILNKLKNHTWATERCLDQNVSLIILIYFGFYTFGWRFWMLALQVAYSSASRRACRSCQETQVLIEFYRAAWNALNAVFLQEKDCSNSRVIVCNEE